jgi:hypothetical protein
MIINYSKLSKNRERNTQNIEHHFLLNHISDIMIDSFKDLSCESMKILELYPRSFYLKSQICSLGMNNYSVIALEEECDVSNQYNLVFQNMGLYYVENVTNFLAYIHHILDNEGYLIMSFPLFGSLTNLKKYIIECEIEGNLPHSTHFMPMPIESRIYEMFKANGFGSIIISIDDIELEYDQPLDLLRELKSMGEVNLFWNGEMLPRSIKTKWNPSQKFLDILRVATVICKKTLK